MEGFDRITHDPNVMGGRACIRGMRVTVALVVNLVSNGRSAEEIVEDYPYLESEDVGQALRYAAWLAEEAVDGASQVQAKGGPDLRDVSPRPFGLCAGEFTVPDDFNDPLPEQVLREFEGRSR